MYPLKEINGWEKNFFWSLKSSSYFFVITEWYKRCCPSYTKKWMDQLIIDYDTRFDMWPQFIAFFHLLYDFVIFIEPKYRSRSCDNTRTVIYISAKKKVLIWLQVRILVFYHKLFPWAWMIFLSPHCCCIHVYCDVCSWWLYNMLENYKLHHPCNDNTRTMQKQ